MKKIIVIVIVLVVIQQWGKIQDFIDPLPDYAALHDGKVILYATSTCSYCKKTRKLMSDNNIDYFEYDINKSKEGRAQYTRIGKKVVPVLLINSEIITGYNPTKILQLTGKTRS